MGVIRKLTESDFNGNTSETSTFIYPITSVDAVYSLDGTTPISCYFNNGTIDCNRWNDVNENTQYTQNVVKSINDSYDKFLYNNFKIINFKDSYVDTFLNYLSGEGDTALYIVTGNTYKLDSFTHSIYPENLDLEIHTADKDIIILKLNRTKDGTILYLYRKVNKFHAYYFRIFPTKENVFDGKESISSDGYFKVINELVPTNELKFSTIINTDFWKLLKEYSENLDNWGEDNYYSVQN